MKTQYVVEVKISDWNDGKFFNPHNFDVSTKTYLKTYEEANARLERLMDKFNNGIEETKIREYRIRKRQVTDWEEC